MSMDKGRPGFLLFFEDFAALEILEPARFKEFVCALKSYAESGTEPAFKDATQTALFVLFRSKIDRDRASYERRVEQRRNASRSRWKDAGGDMRDDADASGRKPTGDVTATRNVTAAGDGNADASPDPRIVALEALKERIRRNAP
ncbi:MAG: hypothetical protein J5998_14215 [Clostridia bacterium]|nr:hypothetical protein [Clostridia bacterium]